MAANEATDALATIAAAIDAIQVIDSKPRKLRINPVDADGISRPVDGIPQWTVDGPATIEVEADGYTAVWTRAGDGPLSITVESDVLIGDGVHKLSETIKYNLAPIEAVKLGLTEV